MRHGVANLFAKLSKLAEAKEVLFLSFFSLLNQTKKKSRSAIN